MHRWLARRSTPGVLVGGLGDDAAVLRSDAGRAVLCVDATVEGVHFEPGTSATQVGRKAARRALSDLAACAATPRSLLLALSAPRACEEAWLRRAIAGVIEAGERHGAALVGGDLTCAEGPVALSVTALGRLGGRRPAPARSRARPGQDVLLSGPVGGSALGRHLSFEARIEAGQFLFEQGATAMMDISDGLAWDLFRLARASRVAIELDHVPVHKDARRAARESGRTPGWHALHDGEDHELVATLAPRGARRAVELAARGRAAICPALTRIGRVLEGQGLWLIEEAGRRRWTPQEGGFRHGAG